MLFFTTFFLKKKKSCKICCCILSLYLDFDKKLRYNPRKGDGIKVENFTNFEKKLLLYLFECALEIKKDRSEIRPLEVSFAEESKEVSSESIPRNIFLELTQIEEKIGIDSWTLESSLKKLFEIKYTKEFEEEKHFFSLFSVLAINKYFLMFF